jgi:oligosaccharide repeat unit polymerase
LTPSAAISGLLLVALLEALFLPTHSTEAIFATLLGVPVGWYILRFASRMREVTIDVFSPTVGFPAAYVVWFGLGSFTFFIDANPPPYLYFVLGFFAYITGTFIAGRKLPIVDETQRAPKGNPWVASHFRFVMIIFFLLMAGSYLLLIAQIGIPAIHEDVAIRREALGLHHYLVAVLQSSAMTLMIFSAADMWSTERLLAPAVSCGMVGLAVLMLGSFGNRGFIATPVLTLLILWHYWKRPIPAKRLMALTAVMFVASVLYDYARARAVASSVGDNTWSEVLLSSGVFTLHTNLSNFRDIVRAIPSEVPYQHGYLTFGVLLQILPGRHESSDEFFKRILASDFLGGGQPGTVLAPFYGDFGVGGMLIGMFLFGACSVKVYGWMRKNPTMFRVLIYSWLAQTAVLSLYGALVSYIITLWLPFMWWILDRWMSRAPESIERLSQRTTRSLRPA